LVDLLLNILQIQEAEYRSTVDDEFTAVMDAAYHLKLLVERCLLVYLGCDHDQAVRATSLLDGDIAGTSINRHFEASILLVVRSARLFSMSIGGTLLRQAFWVT